MTLSGDSKVLTNQICDANGENCLNIHDLNAGGNNENLDVEGSHGQRCRYDCEGNDMERMWLQMYHEYCYNKPENQCNEAKGKFLEKCTQIHSTNQCQQIMTSQPQCKIVCDQVMPTIPTVGNGKITIKQGSNSWSFYLNSNSTTSINLATGGGGGATVNGNNDYICVKSGSNLSCSKAKLGTLNDGKRCTYNSSSKTIDCNSTPPAGGGNGNSNTIQPLTIQGNGTAVTQFDGSSAKTLNIVAGSNITITTGNNQIKISANNGAGLGNLNPTSSDSLRKIDSVTASLPGYGSNTIKALQPKDSTNNLYIANDIYHDGSFNIKMLRPGDSSYRTGRLSEIHIHGHGVSIGELANRTAGLGVHGPITVGKYMLSEEELAALSPGQCASTNRNTISIYASGNSVGVGEHFEIIGTPRILIGVKDGAYMYFDESAFTNLIGINKQNPTATLDINGGIRIGHCGISKKCTQDNVGEIRYYEKSNKGYFVGCRRKSNGSADSNFERVILSDGTTIATDVSYNCTDPVVPYDPSTYQDQGVLAQEQPACK